MCVFERRKITIPANLAGGEMGSEGFLIPCSNATPFATSSGRSEREAAEARQGPRAGGASGASQEAERSCPRTPTECRAAWAAWAAGGMGMGGMGGKGEGRYARGYGHGGRHGRHGRVGRWRMAGMGGEDPDGAGAKGRSDRGLAKATAAEHVRCSRRFGQHFPRGLSFFHARRSVVRPGRRPRVSSVCLSFRMCRVAYTSARCFTARWRVVPV